MTIDGQESFRIAGEADDGLVGGGVVADTAGAGAGVEDDAVEATV
jgi:hypothetical protein